LEEKLKRQKEEAEKKTKRNERGDEEKKGSKYKSR